MRALRASAPSTATGSIGKRFPPLRVRTGKSIGWLHDVCSPCSRFGPRPAFCRSPLVEAGDNRDLWRCRTRTSKPLITLLFSRAWRRQQCHAKAGAGERVSHAVAPSGGSVRVGEWPTMDFALRNGVPSMRFETHAAGARLLPLGRSDRKPKRMQATRRARHSQG